jgi:hypothetical protein
LASLAAQLPLWPLRTHLGWRVERSSALTTTEPPKSLSIGDILVGTSVTAVTLTLVRLVPNGSPSLWAVAAIMAAVVCGISVIAAFPALLLTLRMRELPAGIALLALYALIVGFVLIAVFATAPGGGPPGEFVLGMFIAIYAFAATVISPLLVLRSHGYRLSWPSDRKKSERAA